jgi:hypothetical protein
MSGYLANSSSCCPGRLVGSSCRPPDLLAAAGVLIDYFAEPHYAAHLETATLRSIRTDTSERFDPPR